MTENHNTADSCDKSEEENAAAYLPEYVTLLRPAVTTEQIAEDIGEEHPDLAFWRARAEW